MPARHRFDRPPVPVVAARGDSLGDVLLCEPALRSLAVLGPVTLLCSPRGAEAARMIDAVDAVVVDPHPWMVLDPPAVDRATFDATIDRLAECAAQLGVVFTSPRQNALPTALLLRLAGVPHVSAYSGTYPGSLLDVRIREERPQHEVERNLALVAAAGVAPVEDRRIRVRVGPAPADLAVQLPGRYVVVHPGSAVAARTLTPLRWIGVVEALQRAGHEVVVSGLDDTRSRLVTAACPGAVDLTGSTSLAALAAVLAGADVVCVGNTGAMHLAAAVGTPVVACFPPTVPVSSWRPWMVPHVVLQTSDRDCAPCYRIECSYPTHPCADVTGEQVVAAVGELLAERLSSSTGER